MDEDPQPQGPRCLPASKGQLPVLGSAEVKGRGEGPTYPAGPPPSTAPCPALGQGHVACGPSGHTAP